MRIHVVLTTLLLGNCFMGNVLAQQNPQAEITNGQIHAKLYLPDARTGFYRGTRFDWAGAISSLTYAGHNYYGPWFTRQDPAVRDFVYKDPDIVVSAESGSMGPIDEFQTPLGFDTAKPGETFVKVGVGILRRPDATPYNAFKKYELVDPGKWQVKPNADNIEFIQTLDGVYTYTKRIRLLKGSPQMEIDYTLRNTGTKPIETKVYNHNFLTLDQAGTGPDYIIKFPFEVKTNRPPDKALAEISGNQIAYVRKLQDRETVAMPVEGFSADPKDYDIRVENRKLGAGLRIVGDQPIASMALWSIRSVVAIEPFVAISIAPGREMTWKYTYTYYTLPQ